MIIQDFINAVEDSLETRNWYAALFVSLSLPDICGFIESPCETSSKNRYERWFDKYLLSKYSSRDDKDITKRTFLSSSDCYALRCAFLHEGRDSIEEQCARDVLERFHFVEPPSTGIVHCNRINNILQLQVDIFCDDVVQAVKTWVEGVQSDENISTRLNDLLTIHKCTEIPGIRI